MTIVEHQPHHGALPADLPTTMRAGVLVGTRELELRTFNVPRPGPGQALVRIRATALAEPVSCVVHSVRALQPELGDDVVVIGAGPMGLLNVLVLKRRGARVIVCELDFGRREKARSLGADAVLDPAAGDIVAEVKA